MATSSSGTTVTGTSGADNLNGGAGDDILDGGAGNDTLSGGSGSDTLNGGTGDDRLNGGSGDDTLDGGSGSDTLNGDSGNDLLIYRLAENAGAGDVYTGGSGIDTVRLMLTNAEWLTDSVQAELARYFAHLATVQTNLQGEVSNGSARDFTFNFGSSTTLTVQMMERLEVSVDGVIVGNLDKPSVDTFESTIAGSVVEDGNDDSNGSTVETVSGSIKFFDLDTTDTHTVSVTPPAGAIGGLTASITNSATGDGQGIVSWSYTLNDAAAQSLAAGETRTEVFVVKIQDDDGQFVTQNVTITITGTNDAPTITVAGTDASGAVTEDAVTPTLSDTGTIAFNDVDLIDVHLASVVPTSGTLGGTLTLGAVSESATTEPGTVGWTYQVANSATQYLAVGQTATETFTVTIDDQHGGTTSQLVTVTVTGTNDAPTITVAGTDASGAVTEDAATPTLSDTGTIAFNDVDLIDVHLASVVPTSGTLGGTLTLGAVSESATTEPGTVGWTYQVANSATQYLAVGQTATEQFTVTISDGNGGSVAQVVTVTVTGTNDAPTISVADGVGAVTEDASPTTLSDTGTIAFDDVDLIDVHSTSVAAAVGNTLGGVLTASVTDPATGAGDGTVTWNYSVANSATQYLAVGQTATEQFTVTISDGNGGSVAQVVTVTVTGTNDAPTISVADGVGAVTEDASPTTLSDTGTIAFDDVDLIDVHSTSVAAAVGNTLGGVLTASVTDPATGAGDGTVTWNYSVANSATQYLAVGQTATEQFTVTISDGNGGSVAQVVTVTVTGTNDAPTISVADGVGAVTEDASPTTLSDTGTIAFDDVDLIDVHSTSVAAAVGNTLGGVLTASVTDPATGAGDGTVTWNYSVANSATQYLAVGQTATEQFTVTISDGNGGSVAQVVTVTVTGTNDAPTISVADGVGAVTEDASPTTLSDTGTIAFDDVDLIDVHSTSVAAAVGNTLGGVLTASVTDPATGAGDGTVTWNYSVANSATQYLAVGQTATEQFTVTISDGNGGSVAQVVTVTVTGTNDAPTISVADGVGAVTEDASPTTLSDTGTIAFDDVDLIDVHSTSVAAAVGNTLGGVLTASVTDPATGAGDGTVTWNYSVANSATQYLAVGQTATEQFTVTISDGNGGSVAQVVTVTVTGTNDAPTISVADGVGAVTEDASPTTLSDTGTIAFDDVDLIDVHSTSVAAAVGNTLGGVLTASVTDPATGAGDGTVTWNYSVANSATQYLAAGQTVNEQFTVTINDGHGGTVSQLVTVTATGTNDAPVLNAAATPVLSSVGEDAGAPVGVVGTLVSSLVNLNPPPGGLDNVTDADSGAVTGIALTATNNADGTWYYSTNNGGSWTAVGSVSNAQALLLAADANTRIYFQANANFNGNVTDAVTFRAWDQTTGTAGNKVDTAVNGGSTAFSTGTDTANLSVTGVNDNPNAAADRVIVSSSTAVTIAASALLGNDTDVDGLSLSITSVSGAAGITGLTLNADGSISFTSGATAGASAGSFQYTVSDGAGGSTTATVTIDVRAVNNGNGADTVDLTLSGAYQASYIDGRGGADDLTGGAVGDIFIGGTGNGSDTLTGAAGDDLLIGGDGNDTLAGGAGNDILRGGLGNNDSMDGGTGTEDMLDFSDGTAGMTFTLVQSAAITSITNGTAGLGNNDTYMNMEGVIGTSLNDTITGSAGDDIIRGGGGNDTLNGGAGTADLWDLSDATAGVALTLVQSGVGTAVNLSAAGLGTDTYSNFEGVIGTNFADTLTGSSSADTIRGGGGNDTINGAGGNDILVGGAGVDILTGGIGSDSFRFLGSDPSAVDTITDFDSAAPGSGGDVLDISDLLIGAPTLNAGNVSQYLDIRESGSDSIISIDRDGTGSTYGFQDFAVLTSVTGLNLNTLLTNGNIDYTP